MSNLIVVAHPDDEVLGAGGTIYTLTKRGEEVNVVIMSGQVEARQYRPSNEELENDTDRCMEILGVNRKILGNFPNIQLNTIPHLKLVQFIENAIIETKATNVFTHHPADLNNDHLQTSLACQAAVRLFQRKQNIAPLQKFLFMEIPSSSEWSLNSSMNSFRANTFFEIGNEGINKKIEALSMYRGVMREYPHPRSRESLRGLAAYRGSQAGMNFAEAFEIVFMRF